MLLPTLIFSSLSVRSRFEVMMLAILLVLLVFAVSAFQVKEYLFSFFYLFSPK